MTRIISWNCQSLGDPQSLVYSRLRELCYTHAPDILFLMETKKDRNILHDLQVWLGFDHLCTINPCGLSGGLAILWKHSVHVKINYEDKNLIDLLISSDTSDWFLSCIYGPPIAKLRPILWERITRLSTCRNQPWCLIGDFNAILNNDEKLGGPARSDAYFAPFVDMIKSGGFEELPSSGNAFSWAGMRHSHWIQCRLDRCFANRSWLRMFPRASQTFLDKRGSDHRPVLLVSDSSVNILRGRFRFNKKYMLHSSFRDLVTSTWNTSVHNASSSVFSSLKLCRREIGKWKQSELLNSKANILALEKDLDLEETSSNPCLLRIKALKHSLLEAHKSEELHWFQRSRDQWLSLGDKNTAFYHSSVKSDKARIFIESLIDDSGQEVTGEFAKGRIAIKYFEELFASSSSESSGLSFSDFPRKVSDDMNQFLTSPITAEEIRIAAFSIKGSSAPGPDGMTSHFFQQFWPTVGPQVISEVQHFFSSGSLPLEWNFTHICLLPKIRDPKMMAHLRPISLCSVMYKIISKILIKRLQPFMSTLISQHQSAFVSNRLISDNILIAHELVSSLHDHPSISSSFLLIKSDMSKAFDRVEWSYIKDLLHAFGFHSLWISWILACVTTVSYSVLLNGRPHGLFYPRRGIRQGDPISPFLFALCSEGLSFLLNKAVSSSELSGIQFSPTGPIISHLLFADDSLFVCKADAQQCQKLQEILNSYCSASGQQINLEKSYITFGSNIPSATKVLIKSILGISQEGGSSSYLGLPECFRKSKVELLSYISDNLKSRFSSWFARSISFGGKEVLLKSVAMAMPLHAMSCFRLPKQTCKSLTSAMSNFWWNNGESRRKIHWISWNRLCLPKDKGGLGFRDLESFNQALLAKQAWRLLNDPHCLFTRVFKSKYFPLLDFLDSSLGSKPSYAWRSILFGRELLQQGIAPKIGNGNSTLVWGDSWIWDSVRWRPPLMKNCLVNIDLKVSSLIDVTRNDWNRNVLRELFYPEDVRRICLTKPAVDRDDSWSWHPSPKGMFNVKSAYSLASQASLSSTFQEADQLPSLNPLKVKIWDLKAPPKIKSFLWRALCNAIPVADNLKTKRIRCDTRCQACGAEEESVNHVLFSCTLARQIWALSDLPSPEHGFHPSSPYVNFSFILHSYINKGIPEMIRRTIPWILWILWKNRNKLVFEGQSYDPPLTIKKICGDAAQWFLAQATNTSMKVKINGAQASAPPKTSCWSKPEPSWLKCNIGFAWSRHSRFCGASWILRNSQGIVLLHSRRSFSHLNSLRDAQVHCLLWAIDCMKFHHCGKVIFALNAKSVIDFVLEPESSTQYSHLGDCIRSALSVIDSWQLTFEPSFSNRGASLIAVSVIQGFRFHSYVAAGPPSWLLSFFESEKKHSVIV